MAITGENIHSFQYVDFESGKSPLQITNYLTKKIEDIESKHIVEYKDNTNKFVKYYQKVGYTNVVIGTHRNINIEDDFYRIQNMSKSICKRAVRFVISRDGRVWADNTHWTLAYLMKKGVATTILEIPSYIIDFRNVIPTIYDKDGVVFDSIFDIKSAIASAKRIQERLDLGWRPSELSYTIKELYHDMLSVIDREDSYNVKD